MKKLIPALCMLLVAAALMGTSTYAWFSMNEHVTAQGMKVKAVAEEGIFISNAEDGEYSDSASSLDDSVAGLKPTSTSAFTTWYHSTSDNPALSTSNGTYTDVSSESGYYVAHKFYIRSSSPVAIDAASIDVESVTVTGNTQALSKAIRVGVKIGDETVIYAPLAADGATYNVWNGADRTTSVTAKKNDVETPLAVSDDIPANTDNGTEVTIYIWFEGEDSECKSSNLAATLDELEVSVMFGFTPTT